MKILGKKSRMAFIVITFSKESRALLDIVSVLNNFERMIIGSINVPDKASGNMIFGILVRADTDELGAMTGPLGKIPGVKVRSAVLPAD